MGEFIISRDERGVCFCLLSGNGRRLATSRTYATLDACKKGIASVMVNAPQVPLVDASAGEYGPNPKLEIAALEGGYGFLLKSANGKSVLTSPAYATKKACLRAASMLRCGVPDAQVVLLQKQGPVPVVMTAHLAALGVGVAPAASASEVVSDGAAFNEIVLDEAAPDLQPDDVDDAVADVASEVAIDAVEEPTPAPTVLADGAPSAASCVRSKLRDVPRGKGRRRPAITAENISRALKKTSQDIADLFFWRK